MENFKRIGIEVIEEISVTHIGVGNGKEVVVEPYLCIGAIVCVYPVDCTSYLSAVGSVASPCFGVVLCVNLNDIAVFVLFTAGTFYNVSSLQAHLVAGIKSLILLNRLLHKVLGFNVAFS